MIPIEHQKRTDDFRSFASRVDLEVPPDLESQLWGRLQPLLEPSSFRVFFKLFLIHGVVGSLSLLICHQFELNPFRTKTSLANWFIHLGGHSFCLVACGILFVSLTYLAASKLLTVEEFRALKRTESFQALMLGLTSILTFHFLGAELNLESAGLWMLGVLIGGFTVTEGLWFLRSFQIQLTNEIFKRRST